MLSIGAFSKISNVTTKTLRYYDEIGLLKPDYVNHESGYRYYDVSQLRTVLLISRLKGYCFTLEEISMVLKEPDSRLAVMMEQKEESVHKRISHLNSVLKQMHQDRENLKRGIHIMAYLDQIEIKLTETKPQTILSIRKKMNVKDYGKYMGKIQETIQKEQLTMGGAPMTIFHDKEFNPDGYDMEIAVPVKEVVTGTKDLPGCLCAMGVLKGSYEQLPSIYSKLNQWVEKEKFEVNGSPFEIYLTNPADTAPEDYVTEVYIPVKKA